MQNLACALNIEKLVKVKKNTQFPPSKRIIVLCLKKMIEQNRPLYQNVRNNQ